MCTCTYTCTHTSNIHTYTYTHIWTYAHVHAHRLTWSNGQKEGRPVILCVLCHIHIINIHTHTHTYKRAYIHTHVLPTCTHIPQERLTWFNGQKEGRPIILCILGHCYDVTEGKQFYFGETEGYNCFVGRDGTRAFVTGKFTDEDATDDISDFDGKQLLGVAHWREFYANHHVYKKVGVVAGKYFDDKGVQTTLVRCLCLCVCMYINVYIYIYICMVVTICVCQEVGVVAEKYFDDKGARTTLVRCVCMCVCVCMYLYAHCVHHMCV
jgi:hypothetical protein